VVTSSNLSDIEVRFLSDISYLDLVQDVSDNVSKMMGFDPDSQYWIGLSVREAVTNAIQHGNKGDPTKKVFLGFRMLEDRLIITVRDQGHGITEDQIPDPLDPQNLLKPGGRGIFFVRSFMDNVSFNSPQEGGSELLMEKFKSQNNKGDENDD
jgi:serine/threonine-protein kinase RsbW